MGMAIFSMGSLDSVLQSSWRGVMTLIGKIETLSKDLHPSGRTLSLNYVSFREQINPLKLGLVGQDLETTFFIALL